MFDTEAHLALFAVECEDNGFNFVANFHEVLSRTEVLRPRHFTYVDKTFYARSDFNECTVVSHNDNFTFNFVANFEVGIESIPRMGLKLFETESNAFFLIVKVEDNHVEFLVEANNFFGMIYAAPRKVCDVDKTIYATEVDEYTVSGDVLNCTFEYLTFFKLGDDIFLLLFEFGFNKSLVRYNDILEFLIDFYNLEFHCLANEDVVITDRLNIDLRTGKECFDAKYINNHTTLSAALDVTLDDFVVFEGFINTIPTLGCASLLV